MTPFFSLQRCHGICVAFTSPLPVEHNAFTRKWNSECLRARSHARPPLSGMQLGACQSLRNTISGSSSLSVTTHSWKFPRWYAHQLLSSSDKSANSDNSKGLARNEHTSASMAQQPRCPPPKRIIALKVLCASILLANVTLAWGLYFSFTKRSQETVAELSTEVLGRPLRVGRIVRLLPSGGLRIGKSKLLRDTSTPTAPEISARCTDIWLGDIWGAIVSSKPVLVNASLTNAEISVYQKVIMGPKGKETTQWDPGLPPRIASNESDKAGFIPSEQTALFPHSRLPSSSLVQPGNLSIEKSTVFLHSAVLPDYGHGGEVVEVRNVSASVTFPKWKDIRGTEMGTQTGIPVELEGEFQAQVQGLPVGGGSIDVSARADGKRIMSLQPGDEICNLHVRGENISAPKIAAFLSLPFRANVGQCSGDVNIHFLHRTGTLIPDMHGEVDLEDLSLRFHPDPKTPEFVDLAGKLRFDRKDLFLDGARGTLGTLPLTVVGDIALDGEYNLLGYIPSVDVNNVLETFDVEKFVPVTGQVKGEAKMTGILEEPTIVGWAETTSEEVVFDRLPLASASVDFEWEAIAGTLKFTDIRAKIAGQGTCTGEGGLYFDMTKETPFGISRRTHHINSPKAAYWNSDATQALPAIPEDDLEIDEYAPYRSYDSMSFNFKVEDVKGSDLLHYYGGKFGGMAALSVGTVEGAGVLAGHAKDANCRVTWRSVSPPPAVTLRGDGEHSPEERPAIMNEKELLGNSPSKTSAENPVSDAAEGKTIKSQAEGEDSGADDAPHSGETISKLGKEKSNGSILSSFQNASGSTFNISENQNSLGGGDFQGLVYIKLGDLPAARRVKVRTTVKGLDARRLGWLDKSVQGSLSQVPLLNTSVDTYFKGVMHQRPIIPLGCTEVPRAPRMELLGADGALAVRRLSMNQVKFPKTMAGSFSFSTSDFSMSLKEIARSGTSAEARTEEEDGANETSDIDKPAGSTNVVPELADELTVSASLKGEALLRLRQGKTSIVASAATDKSKHQVVDVFAQGVAIQDVLGEDFISGESSAVTGIFDTNAHLNLTTRKGEGSFTLQNPRIGPFRLKSVSSEIQWRGQDLSVHKCLMRSRSSEFEVTGNVALPVLPGSVFAWDASIDISRASLGEIVRACQKGSQIAKAIGPASTATALTSARPSDTISWMQRLSQASSSADSDSFSIVDVPDGTLADQANWFDQYLVESKRFGKQRDIFVLEKVPEKSLTIIDPEVIQGNVDGKLRIKYEKKGLQKKKTILVSRTLSTEVSPLDIFEDLSAEFELNGTNWSAGNHTLSRASVKGRLLNNTFSIGTLRCEGEGGFFAQAKGYMRSDGTVKMYADMEKAPASLLAAYFQAPVVAGGDYNGHLDIKGNLRDPAGEGSLVWTNATLNGQKLHEARSELKCEKGRCAVNVFARVDGKGTVRTTDETESNGQGRKKGEVLRVSVELPVHTYWNRVLRRSIPTPVYDALLENGSNKFGRQYVDEQIRMIADIRKFGLVFLNAVLPDLQWTGGSADVNMEVSGSLRLPVVKGHVSVRDGQMWPRALAEPLDGVRGEVIFDEVGTVSLKSVYGRCNGKGLHVHGDALLSEQHRVTLNEVATHGRLLSSAEATMSAASVEQMPKDELKALVERRAQAAGLQEKVNRGLTFEMGDVPVHVKDVFEGTVSGRVVLKRTLANPEISGTVGVSKGAIFLSNPSSPGDANIARGKAKDGFRRAERKLQLRKSSLLPNRKNSDGIDGGISQNRRLTIRSKAKSSVEETREEIAKGATSVTENVASQGSKIDLKNLRISVGRDMQIVYPFLLNLEAHGNLEISGPLHKPEPQGTIYFSQGQVNLLASRMDIKRGEESYARFERGSGDEPILNIALEDDDMVVRIHDALPSKWSDHLEIKTKRGGELGDSSWAQVLQSRLESGDRTATARSVFRKLANTYVTQVAGTKGNIGSIRWRLHPILGGVSGESSGNVAEDLGAGAKISYGKGSLLMRKALSGVKAMAFEFRPWKWLGLQFESEGELKHMQVEIRIGRHRKQKKERTYKSNVVEDVMKNEQANKVERGPE